MTAPEDTAPSSTDGRIALSDLGGGVQQIEIDRPAKRNALTNELMRELAEALRAVDEDPDIRAVVLCSPGPVFCAGADLTALAGPAPADDPGSLVLERIARMRTPVVAAVQGAAVGMGATMLLHCDAVYATEHGGMRMPFVQLGLTPEGGATVILPQVAGPARARRILLLGEPMPAQEAVDCGLWTEVVEDSQLWEKAHAAAQILAQLPADALAATRRLLRPAGFEEQLEHEALAFSHQRMVKG